MIRRNVLTQPSGTVAKMEAAHIFYDQQVGTRDSPRKVTERAKIVGRRANFLLLPLRLQLYKVGSLVSGNSELVFETPNLGIIMGLLGPVPTQSNVETDENRTQQSKAIFRLSRGEISHPTT